MKKVLMVAIWIMVVALFSSPAMAIQSVKLSDSQSDIKLLSDDQSGITVQVTVGTVDFTPVTTQQGEFILPTVSGFSRATAIGAPALPVAGRLISIPYGCELSVTVIGSRTQQIDLASEGMTAPLFPAQPSLSKSQNPEDVNFEYNYDLYRTSGFYTPRELATAEILGIMRSVRIGRVMVCPFEYDPVQKILNVYTDVTVRIEYRHPDWSQTDAMHLKYYSPVFEPLFEQFLNRSAVYPDKGDLTRYPVKYLIISDRMFEAQLQPFIEWKTRKGFNVVVDYTDEIGTSSSAISAHIESVYNAGTPADPAPSFVLFVGDDQQIPAFDGTAGSHITDLYFCEFTNDVFPEIYYGRFSAQNPTQLQPQIDKTLEYERYEMPDPSYLDEVTLVSGVDGSYAITYGNGQINYGTNYYFNAAHGITPHVWLYPASAQGGASTAIKQTISDGVGLYNYTAHCSHEGHADPSFVTSDIPGLTNYHQYLLGIGNCCLANTFGSDYGSPCFGEAFLQIADKGGIGYIGASNSTYWDEDYWWGVGSGPIVGSGPTYEQTTLGAYDGVFHDFEPDTNFYVANDAIIFAGNLGVTAAGSGKITYYWEAYHLMGDPSLMTYLGIPATNNVSYPDALIFSENSLTVYADPGSYVGISYNGELHGAGYVDDGGSVLIAISPFTQPCVAEVVVTAQNKQPHLGTIQVIAPDGAYVIYDDADVDDYYGGNGNAMIDYGESIVLGVQLKNVGPDDANGVTATLSSADPYITLTDNTETYGFVAGNNGTVYVADAFAFDVAADVPDGHAVPLTVTMHDDLDSTWVSNFVLHAHAPTLAYLDVDVSDASGNNNGIFDPGETVDITVTIENTGSGEANNVAATLSTADAFIFLDDASGAFNDLLPDGTASNDFDVFTATADGATPLGHEVTFDLEVTADNGMVVPLSFMLIVGDRVPFFSDDFSFNQGWTGLAGSGEWTIGPCTGGAGADSYGGPDPANDHTPTGDNYVLGNDLTSGTGGDYAASLGTTYWVTSPVIDCADFNGCILSFWRWLGIEKDNYDNVYFQVNDGSGWTTLFENGGSDIDDQSWTYQEFDVSSYADYNSNFQIRFGIGSTDGSYNFCGWNIDDLEIKGYGEYTFGLIGFDQENMVDSMVPGDVADCNLRVYNYSEDGTLRVCFGSPEEWIAVADTQCYIPPQDSLDFTITLNTTDMIAGDYIGHLTYVSNDMNNKYDTMLVMLHLYAPVCDIAVDPIVQTLEGGAQSTQSLMVNNLGPGRLIYSVSCQMFDGKSGTVFAKPPAIQEPLVPIGIRATDDDKSEQVEEFYAPVNKSAGGPDNFGYSWIDSDDAGGPQFDWVDISAVGTAVALGDDNFVGPFAIGFAFPFYENAYEEVYIGSNGLITFGQGSSSRTNTSFPNPTNPDNLIAIWWDDLDPAEYGSTYYYYDAANERFIVSFVNVPNYYSPDGTGSLNFQAILYPNGQIILQYETMDAGADSEGLTGASVGIENLDGSDGLTVVYNAEYMHDNLAISFRAARWMAVTPGGGTIEPFESDTLTITFDAADLDDGSYTGQVSITTNDENNPSVAIPVTLTIESYICGDANGDLSVNVGDVVFVVNYVFKGGPAPDPYITGDANNDDNVDVADAVYVINFAFKSGPAPVCQ